MEVKIEITGRIPKYYFGVLKEKFQEEIQEALLYVKDENIQTTEDFVRLIFDLTSEITDPVKALWKTISKANLKKLPNLYETITEYIKDDSGSMSKLIEELFDTVGDGYVSDGCISFFENDATMIVSVDEEVILKDVKLKEFVSSVESGNNAENRNTEAYQKVKALMDKNPKFVFTDDENSDFPTWEINEQGCLFVTDWLSPESLTDFSENQPYEHQVTICFDTIVTWIFNIETDDFKMSDLTFLKLGNSDDFRDSSAETVFNYMFYKNELIDPIEIFWRYKAVDLHYGEDRTESLRFLLEG